MSREEQRRGLEKTLKELEGWLLRDEEGKNPVSHFSSEILQRYGPGIKNDSTARVIRYVIKQVLDYDKA